MRISLSIPRVKLAFLPTPLVLLKNLSKHLGGPRIYIKRDDCTGLVTGGNKTRKLEFLMADALKSKADTIITAGALQSNHARQTAAAATLMGLKCELVLTESRYRKDIFYQNTGNPLLDQILDAKLHIVNADADVTQEMTKIAEVLKVNGHTPYSIPIGGSNALGALGYVTAMEELYEQCHAQDILVTHLVLASCSGGTQAGTVIGRHLLDWDLSILGISVGAPKTVTQQRVQDVIRPTCKLLNINDNDLLNSLNIDDNYTGVGYGQPTKATIAAIKLVAKTEGILLDPVYTGKAMAGLIDYIHQKRFSSQDTIVFLHTGGSVALNAYSNEFNLNLYN
jgi:D-cysteine desulfhydrase family pyridoxal phosphate-dependent enzyme